MFSLQTKKKLMNFFKKCCFHYFRSSDLNHFIAHFKLSQKNFPKKQFSEMMEVDMYKINTENCCLDFVKGNAC